MGSLSIWHWSIIFFIIFVTVFPTWRIVSKAGFSGWWSLLSFIPVVGFFALWIFALVDWPAKVPADK
ncbi:MAG: hypothetical protein EBS11_26370 [Janthinobacterium sp.]|nr:hypothetical protein [Janthinobacterium sp.]